jgi:glycogen operon protein
MLSQGVPMLLGGDEFGRTKGGNNNAYCQDNEITWYDWQNVDEELLDFCRKLIRFRRSHPSFRRRGWFQGKLIHGSGTRDIAWFSFKGEEMTDEDWEQGKTKSLGIFLNGALKTADPQREGLADDNFYILINADHEHLACTLPDAQWGSRWRLVFATDSGWEEDDRIYGAGGIVAMEARSLCVLCAVEDEQDT